MAAKKQPPPPPPAASAAHADPPRYRVRSSAVGRWAQGEIVTADDLGGLARVAVLVARGALVEESHE